MANTQSELYEKHPDWVIKAPERDLVLGRGGTQVVLDLGNPQVQDFVFNVVDELMTNYPEIDYIKWDANMSILNHGSNYLGKDEQSHLYIAYHRGLENVCKRIRMKYPELTMQACASGGGRVNYGLLPYFDEFGQATIRMLCNASICSGALPISFQPSVWRHISVLHPIIRLSVPSR